jgi:hypothetical protein
MGPETACGVGGIGKSATPVRGTGETSPAKLDGCLDARDSRFAEPGLPDLLGVIAQSGEAAAFAEHGGGELKSFPAPDAAAEQHRKDLDVAELVRAGDLEPLARLLDGAVTETRHAIPSLVPPAACRGSRRHARGVSGHLRQKSRGSRWQCRGLRS